MAAGLARPGPQRQTNSQNHINNAVVMVITWQGVVTGNNGRRARRRPSEGWPIRNGGVVWWRQAVNLKQVKNWWGYERHNQELSTNKPSVTRLVGVVRFSIELDNAAVCPPPPRLHRNKVVARRTAAVHAKAPPGTGRLTPRRNVFHNVPSHHQHNLPAAARPPQNIIIPRRIWYNNQHERIRKNGNTQELHRW